VKDETSGVKNERSEGRQEDNREGRGEGGGRGKAAMARRPPGEGNRMHARMARRQLPRTRHWWIPDLDKEQ
jgi:ribosomal protein L19E